MRKIFKLILLSLNIIGVIALILSYLSGWLSPEISWIPSFFGLAYPIILLLNVCFIVIWLIFHHWYASISAIAILIGWGFIGRFIQINGDNSERGDIKVLSYNVHHFRGSGKLTQQQTANEIVNFLNKEKPDIVCLQEVRLRQNSIFNLAQTVEKLDFINHYQYARTSNTFGSVTLSRYPILKMGEVRFSNSRNITICTDILVDNDTVRVFNVHLHSYGIDLKDYDIIDSGISSEEDFKEAYEMGSKLKRGFQLRVRQVETIRERIEESPYDVIVCGDLNDTPASYSYQQLQEGLVDAFISSGRGIGRTFINKLPAIRIDYILHSNKYSSYNFNTYNFRHSDHLPVSTELVKNRENN